MSDDNWKQRLTPEQYNVCRLGGTESPFSGKYYRHSAPGVYVCVACRRELFRSGAKYDSGSGWPSFTAPDAATAVALREDHSHGLRRTEVLCGGCGSHLGHVFDDGPAPTGQRWCINSVALDFVPEGA